ncbi:MAG TPA: aspartate/glutamate racemase family protein, partial [Pyrinomonadaceae bacterium]
IKDRIPGVPVVYFSDTGVTPYGKMSRLELKRRLDKVIDHLKSRGTTHIVIGCNAASTAIDYLDDHAVPIFGVIQPAVRMTIRYRPEKLGLIGGHRTVVSGVHRRAFAEHGIGVKQRIAQPLSGMIEDGDIGSDRLHSETRRILKPLRNCSHVLLACTHYPAILPVLRQYAPKVKFLDPAEELVAVLKRQKIRRSHGPDGFLTTGSTATMKKAAKNAFGVNVPAVTRVRL